MDLINSINIDLELDVPENEARSTSQALCEGLVLPALERVMQRFEEKDIVIEQPLVIELGDVPESQLSFALEDAFYRALAKHGSETNIPLEAASIKITPKAVSDVFLEYLQFPVLPWDTDGVTQFDEQGMMCDVAQKALSSDAYVERLASLVMGDVETCKRFFDLPWAKEELLSVLNRLLPKIPAWQGTVYDGLLRLFDDARSVKSSLVREVFYYFLSGLLFGNRRDVVNRETVAALLLVGEEGEGVSVIRLAQLLGKKVQPEGQAVLLSEKAANPETANELRVVPVEGSETESVLPPESVAHHATKKDVLVGPVEELETRLAPEIERAIAEKRGVLKQRLAHKEGRRHFLLRLIQLISMVLKGEASFSQHIAEMERIIEELHRGDSTQLGQDEKGADTPTSLSPETFEKEVPGEKVTSTTEMNVIRLSEEKVVDVMALLSVLHEKELKAGVSGSDKASMAEVVATIVRKQPNIDKRIPVHNAGLVLFQPFLISFFDRLGLLESRKSFNSLESQLKAAHLLHELSGFDGEHLEHLLPLNKLLCGINIMFPIGTTFEITEKERNEVDSLLKATIRNWSAIGNVSPAGFQEAFVRREGLLERSQNEWILRVESKGIDVLLDYIPWDIHTLSYPWNEYLIYVDWKL